MATEIYMDDESVIEALEQLRNDLYVSRKSTEKLSFSPLWKAIVLCGSQQAVMPDWLVDEILNLDKKIQSGRIKDFNEAFEADLPQTNTRSKRSKQINEVTNVMNAIEELKAPGNGIGDNLFAQVSDKLGLTFREVRDIYNYGNKHLKRIKLIEETLDQSSSLLNKSERLEIFDLKITRRRGRSVF